MFLGRISCIYSKKAAEHRTQTHTRDTYDIYSIRQIN